MRLTSIQLLLASTLTSEEALAPPSRSVPILTDFTQQPIPRFRNGFLVGIDSTRTRVRIWDRDWALKVDTPISIPGGGQTIVNDVAVDADGSFAVAATLVGASSTGTIVWCAPSGSVRRVTTTSPFSPRRLAFHSSGDLWAVGWVKNDPDGAAVRVYGATGDLRRMALPSVDASMLIRELFLSVRSYRVGVISFSSGRWIELDLDGRVISDMALPSDKRLATGATVSGGGHLFASFQDRNGVSSIGRLDAVSKSWVSVDRNSVAPDTMRQGLSILGAEGDSLVVRTKPPNTLQWVRVE